MKEEDVPKFLATETHLHGTNFDVEMEPYVSKIKMMLYSSQIWRERWRRYWSRWSHSCCSEPCSSPHWSECWGLLLQWDLLQLLAASYLGIHWPNSSSLQKVTTSSDFLEPRPEHNSVKQAYYVNLPTISLCNKLSFVPCMVIAIPGNKGAHSVDLRWWLLDHVVLRIYVMISHEYPWDLMPHLYYYRYLLCCWEVYA